MESTAQIRLAPAVLAALREAADSAWPHEACGLLLGRRGPEAAAIDAFRRTGNAAADPRRGYLVPPLELLAADGDARAAGREILGVWHSHPDAPAAPSRQDTDEAWEGYSYGIQAATREGAGELRFFALADGAFHELPWTLADPSAGEEA